LCLRVNKENFNTANRLNALKEEEEKKRRKEEKYGNQNERWYVGVRNHLAESHKSELKFFFSRNEFHIKKVLTIIPFQFLAPLFSPCNFVASVFNFFVWNGSR
jgi:hypothetical protein